MGNMKVSICIATYNKKNYLEKVLTSIYRQTVPFDFEVIVVDDGSPDEGATDRVCRDFPVHYIHINRKPGYHNPAHARNLAYKRARGEIIICQSDDVIHRNRNTIQRLADEITPGHFVIASVSNICTNGKPYTDIVGEGYGDKLLVYTSPEKRRPLFFLGSLYRSDLYAVGGNDEDFVDPSREDVWFGLCLTEGLKLKPIYSSVVGLHLHHPHTTDYDAISRSRIIFNQKVREARRTGTWQSAGGAWI